MTEATSKRGAKRRIALLVLGVLLVLGLMVWMVHGLMDRKSDTRKKPPTITLLPDRPPPPPPPPKERPEPPKADQKEMKTEVPKEPQPQAQNEPIKMEGAAGDGPSAFAAGTVNKEYTGGNPGTGRSIGGGAIGGNRMQQSLFSERLQRYLQEELNRNRKLRETDYRVTLSLWLARDGKVQRAELTQSTGNTAVDALLKETLLQVAAIREALPEDLKQPIRIRVTTRGGR